jgi:uncharacterized protein YjbJ (UPF0337 family)
VIRAHANTLEPIVAQPMLSRGVTFTRNTKELEMNEDTLKGQWNQLKGSVREQWGKLTNDDVDQIEGRAEQLVGRIQERYGVARDEAQRQVDAWAAEPRPGSRGV